ncbi:hypothetical protein [Wukongibacter sp. M2B1]|uniref:hypothetical protein n=1 Tax=Wukongibacter sp. M2B1 TaxID=3088895 RepID=UPI003D790F74
MGMTNVIASMLPKIDKYIDDNMSVIKASENAHDGLIVPEVVKKYGGGSMQIDDLLVTLPKMISTIIEMKKSYKSLKDNPYSNRTIIDSSTLEELKSYSYTLGISDIGFTNIDPSMIFRNKKILFKNAIVLTMEMKRSAIDYAPSIKTKNEVFRTYLELGRVVNRIASFLRERGYNAQAGPALGGDVNYPLLAQKAGLGAIGKHGLLISPRFGPSFRIAAVFTDIENLPMDKTNEHMWINSFCEKCNRCVKQCPASAIHMDTKTFDDGSKQCIDYKKCAVPFSTKHGCSVCVKECTFYKNDYYKIKERFK